MRILVVEDEHDLAGAVAAGLRREGYAVDVAGDGRSALDRLGVHAYDMVCLDLNLPDADGLDICRHVVSAPRPGDGTADAPRILVLSARDRVEDRIVGLDHGADDYLVKPFALGELTARVRAAAAPGHGRRRARSSVGTTSSSTPPATSPASATASSTSRRRSSRCCASSSCTPTRCTARSDCSSTSGTSTPTPSPTPSA